jgi:hypothetical protein
VLLDGLGLGLNVAARFELRETRAKVCKVGALYALGDLCDGGRHVGLTRMAFSCEGSEAVKQDITVQRVGLERRRTKCVRERKPSRRGRHHPVARQPSSAATPG